MHRVIMVIALLLGATLPSVVPTRFGALVQPQRTAFAAAPVQWEYKGFTLPSWSANDLLNSGPALDQFAAAGGTSITILVTWYTRDAYDNEVFRSPSTATDDSVIWAIQ